MRTTILVVVALAALAAAGCEKPPGPKTTEVTAIERPAGELMPDPGTADAGAAETVVTEGTPGAVEGESVETAPPGRIYVVQAKDTLWSIAKNLYGDPKRWKDIAEANNITDETKLPVGKVLKIPE